jgi:hypothetical protein
MPKELISQEQPNIDKFKILDKQEDDEINKLLIEAQQNALDDSEMGNLFEKKMRMLNQTPAEFLKNIDEFKKLNTEIKKHIILVKTLSGYKKLLGKIAPSEVVYHTLAHENSHANKAEGLGANLNGYAVFVTKNKNGFIYQPFTDYEIPPSWDLKRQIETNIKIAEAPLEYENSLAPGDIERIKELRRQIENMM